MALFTASDLMSKGQRFVTFANSRGSFTKTASTILDECALTESATRDFDIFLSHAYLDATIVAGLKVDLEEMGFTVYVDWIQDSHLDRTKVDKKTAELLKTRLKQCKSLFFATSDNSTTSKWMPWECGYFDGVKSRVAICPVVTQSAQSDYAGQEYLSLYPYIQKDKPKDSDKPTLWVHETRTKYVIYRQWLAGQPLTERA